MKFIKEIALVFAIVLSVFASSAYIASAQVTPTIPFGGQIISYVLPTPVCPAHTLILDFATFRLLGLVITPGSSQVYMNYNVTSPGAYVLGNASTFPVTCPLPYLIVPVLQIGTS